MLPNWGFRNTVHATFKKEDSIDIPLSIEDANNTNKISLKDFVTLNVPEVKDNSKYWLKPTLFNGTLQTLYTFKADFHKKFQVYFAREIISISNEFSESSKGEYTNLAPGEFTIDYVVNPFEAERDPKVFKEACQRTLPSCPRGHCI